MAASILFLRIPLSPPHPPQLSGFPLKSHHSFMGIRFSVLSLFKLMGSQFGSERPLLCPILLPASQNTSFCSESDGSSNGDRVAEIGAFYSLFQQMGLNERETQAILHKNPKLTFTSLDSIRIRIHSLHSVGLDSLALSKLITKNPDVLTSKEIDPLLEFIHRDLKNQIKPIQIQRLLTITHPKFLSGFDIKVNSLLRNGVPVEKIAHVLNNVNLTKAICLKSVEEIQKTLVFLDRYNAAGIILKRPAILNYDLDTQLIPRIGFLEKLSGGDENAVGQVLNRLPAIVAYSEEHVKGHVEFLRSFAGLIDKEIFKIVLIFPNVMSASKERKLRPRIAFLKECGLDSEEIYRFLTNSALFLGLSFKGNLACKLAMLMKIGYENRTKDLAMAMGAVTRTSCEKLQKVISLLLSYSFSCEDIVEMSKVHPQILQYNPESLEQKVEYLVEDMGREVDELLTFPAFLGYNLETRIKHRYETKKKMIGEEMSINKLLTVSSERFAQAKNRTNSVV